MKPLNLIILLILPVIAITFRMLPEKSVKSSITTGIYIEQEDQWLDSFKKLMGTHSDAFVFEFAGSSDELRNAVESGRYDCGYVIGKDFSANFIEDCKDKCPYNKQHLLRHRNHGDYHVRAVKGL